MLFRSSIEDFAAGDVLQLSGVTGATASVEKLTIAAAGDILNFINSAIKQSTAINKAVYFVMGSDSYVVIDRGAPATDETFTNGSDSIVKLTGVNLDTAGFSFNSDNGTLALV